MEIQRAKGQEQQKKIWKKSKAEKLTLDITNYYNAR